MKRILSIIGVVILALALAGGGLGAYTVRRSFPQTGGTVKVPGLTGTVEIYRDQFGIPHVYADNIHDLFFAQGYLHAQDRFWQMDSWRHITAGRLSEFFGGSQVETDTFLRTVGWHRIAEEEVQSADGEVKAVLGAYAEGVNAYISSRSAADLSLEYSILGLNGVKNYKPEPWTPADSVAWGKSLAWDLRGNVDDEIKRAILLQTIGPEKTADYMPLYPADHPVIIPNPATAALDYSRAAARVNSLNALLGPRFEGIGSNNWVIAGSRTTTGQPLLANDPHLSIQMPGIWYEIGLHCNNLGPDCPYEVTGFSLAGDPGVIIGHNSRIAWGDTNVGPDVQDLYLEKINPDNPNQYEVNGKWVDMEVRTETIKVKGGDDVTATVRWTRHGPIIDDVYWDGQTSDENGRPVTVNGTALGPQSGYALALRWTALEPTRIFDSVLGLNRAQNWNEFRAALKDWAVPSQNFVYADVDGNIGYQTPGNIPIRKNGDGLLPVPGWTDDYEWTGYIPFDQLPYSFNPPQGYIATANNAVVGPDYPHMISLDWDPGYRAQRIVDLIESQDKISPEYIQQIQGDDMNLGAQAVLPYLLALSFDDPKLAKAADALRNWDFQMKMDSQPAAIYAAFFNALLTDTFRDQVPEKYWPSGGPQNWVTVRALLTEPDNDWWDDTATPAVEARDDILQRALADGYAALADQLGSNADKWTWGALHTSTFRNQTLGKSGVAPIEAVFNRGPYAAAGGTSIVNATSFNVTKDDPYAVTSIPSMRMIVDLGHLANSRTIFSTGQSGHAYHPHYVDMADLWRNIQYHPMLWNRPDIETAAEAHLTLRP